MHDLILRLGVRPPFHVRHHTAHVVMEVAGRDESAHASEMTRPNSLLPLRTRLQTALAKGLSGDPLSHAGQVAEIAGVLHEAFKPEGYSPTLVGGSAIEIHAPGIYRSGDLDYVIERSKRATKQVDDIFESLGFKREGGRHWVFGDLFIEVVPGPVAGPTEEVRVGDAVFRIVKKEVALRDRVVGFKQWGYTGYAEQALDMLAAFGNELDEGWLFRELRQEDSLDAFEELRAMARSGQTVTDEILRNLREQLRRCGPKR